MQTDTISASRRAVVFCSVTAACFIVALILGMVLTHIGRVGTPLMRLQAVAQDVLMFIVPTIGVAALLVGPRKMWQWLHLDSLPGAGMTLLGLLAYAASLPIQEALISWNASLPLPDWMQVSEENSENAVRMLLGGTTVVDLIANLLIVGLLAGLSEEFFFRGALQGVLTGKRRQWIAVWIAAAIFSAIHFEFAGFFPRFALGLLFGYLLLWSGSLWLPILLHTLNNSMVVIQLWTNPDSPVDAPATFMGDTSWSTMVISVLATALLLVGCYRLRVNQTSCE